MFTSDVRADKNATCRYDLTEVRDINVFMIPPNNESDIFGGYGD